VIDPILRKAIVQSTEMAGQPSDLALRLIAWIEALVSGNEELTDREATRTRMERLMEAIVVPADDDSGGDR